MKVEFEAVLRGRDVNVEAKLGAPDHSVGIHGRYVEELDVRWSDDLKGPAVQLTEAEDQELSNKACDIGNAQDMEGDDDFDVPPVWP